MLGLPGHDRPRTAPLSTAGSTPWANAPASAAGTVGDLDGLIHDADLEWKTVDVKAAVQSDVIAGRTYSAFRLHFTTLTNADGANDIVWTNDAEGHRGSGNLPRLVVSYRAPRL